MLKYDLCMLYRDWIVANPKHPLGRVSNNIWPPTSSAGEGGCLCYASQNFRGGVQHPGVFLRFATGHCKKNSSDYYKQYSNKNNI